MNFRLILLSLSFLAGPQLHARSYGLIEAAFVEPEEGVVKSIYESNTTAYGLGYGYAFPEGAQLEARLAHREYSSRLNALESNMRVYELGGDVLQVFSRIPNWVDFYLGFGAKVMLLDIAIEDEATNTDTSRTKTTSFAYQYQFGAEYPLPSLDSTIRLSIAREHIYKSAFGNFSLDGHLYKMTWTKNL